ncbi:MAG: DUF1688 family protein, partial [Acidobacteriota bacterium]
MSLLRDPQTIRRRCQRLLSRAAERTLEHVAYHPDARRVLVADLIAQRPMPGARGAASSDRASAPSSFAAALARGLATAHPARAAQAPSAPLLRRLQTARPEVFGSPDRTRNASTDDDAPPRLDGLVDHLTDRARDGALPASALLGELLTIFGPVWSCGGIHLHGLDLGDVWRHHQAGGSDDHAGLLPLHGPAQQLTRALAPHLPFAVTGLDQLCGPVDLRVGRVLLAYGVLQLRDDALCGAALPLATPAAVEWR